MERGATCFSLYGIRTPKGEYSNAIVTIFGTLSGKTGRGTTTGRYALATRWATFNNGSTL